MNIKIEKIYDFLLNEYGCQGWWPLLDFGYHPNDYGFPKNDYQQFEIIVGAILTQNTNFKNVTMALINMKKLDILNPKKILEIELEELSFAIKPTGYFNQKAIRLKIIANFYLELNGRTPKREELMKLKGVGNETADTILLYAYKEPNFVIDAYTNRIFKSLKLVKEKISYLEFKKMIEKNLPKDYKVYNEFHALIVEHAKRYYRKNKTKEDFLKQLLF